MRFINCFDMVEIAIDSFSTSNTDVVRVSPSKKELLRHYCDILQKISDDFDGAGFSVDIDEHTMDITVSLVCEDFEVRTMKQEFINLLNDLKGFGVKYFDDDHYEVSFTFEGIWILNQV